MVDDGLATGCKATDSLAGLVQALSIDAVFLNHDDEPKSLEQIGRASCRERVLWYV